jgi:hypothetical protein
MALVPQVVDVAGAIPVVAAGGIADGRGLAQIVKEVLQGGGQQYVPFAGQSAGLISEVLPADRIVARTVREAERILASLG